MLNRLRIGGKDAVSCIIDGINNAIVKSGAEAGHYTSPEGLLNHLSAISESSHQQGRSFHGKAHSSKQVKPAGRSTVSNCFNCGKPGHQARDCKTPPRKGIAWKGKGLDTKAAPNVDSEKCPDPKPATDQRCYICNEMYQLPKEVRHTTGSLHLCY